MSSNFIGNSNTTIDNYRFTYNIKNQRGCLGRTVWINNTNISGCQCEPGYTYKKSTCLACHVNTYKNIIGSSACALCPAHSTSPVASDKAEDCVCNPGYALRNVSSMNLLAVRMVCAYFPKNKSFSLFPEN